MEGKYLIAIAFLASWTVIIASKLPDIFEEQCPPGTPCPPVLISHKDCNKFYECQNGQKVTITCEAGLYFSKYWRGCVDRQSSDCPVTTTPTPDPTDPPPDPGQCRHGELIKHECRCEKYYQCINGRKALRDCPADHHFDPSISDCVPGPCGTTIPPSTTTTLPSTTTSRPYCREGELIPHECKCTKYYLCKGGRKALRDCPPGKHFDNVTRSGCIDGENCDPPICLDGDRKNHDCDCTQYYECSNNDWYPQYCKEIDHHFNNKTKTCMPKEIAGCDPKIKPPGYCEPENPPLKNHECDCRLYYKCENNVKNLYSCDWGKYFDKVKQKCEILTNVNDCIKIIGTSGRR